MPIDWRERTHYWAVLTRKMATMVDCLRRLKWTLFTWQRTLVTAAIMMGAKEEVRWYSNKSETLQRHMVELTAVGVLCDTTSWQWLILTYNFFDRLTSLWYNTSKNIDTHYHIRYPQIWYFYAKINVTRLLYCEHNNK